MKRAFQIFLAAVLLLPATLSAQKPDATAELRKIRNYYLGEAMKHVSGVMLLRDLSVPKPLDRVDFEYWMQGKQMFSRMNYIEILSNSSVYLMVNRRAKTIYARPQSEKTRNVAAGLLDAEQLGHLLEQNGASVSIEAGRDQNKLVISGIQASKFSTVTITYSAADYHIIGMDAVVKPVGDDTRRLVLEMRYQKSEKLDSGNASIFSEKPFLAVSGKGRFQFNQAYQDYNKL